MSNRLAKYFNDQTSVSQEAVSTETGAEEVKVTISAEAIANSKEFIEARSGVEDIAQAENLHAHVSNGLSIVRSSLESLNAKGGVSQQAAPFFELATNAYVTSVGLNPISLGFEHANFSDETPKQVASFEALDVVFGLLQGSAEKIAQLRIEATQRLNDIVMKSVPATLSMESMADSFDTIQQERQEDRKNDFIGYNEVAQNFRSALAAQNEAGGFSLESLYAASLASDAICGFAGKEPVSIASEEVVLSGNPVVVTFEELDAVCSEIQVEAGLAVTGNPPEGEVPASGAHKPEAGEVTHVEGDAVPEVFDGEGTISEAEVIEMLTDGDAEETEVEEAEEPLDSSVSQEFLDSVSTEDIAGVYTAAKAQSLHMKIADLEETVRKLKAENSKLKRNQKKPSTESLEVSMEANIKDLKTGKKVKFSHGHGKIAKILTGPYKLGHKMHHASKDEPRFLVKADKGGHYSIHKASALTLV